MARPTVPLPKDVIAIASGLKDVGFNSGAIRCADGTEIIWGKDLPRNEKATELEKWKEKCNAS